MTTTYRTRLQAVVDSLGDDPADDAAAATLRRLIYDQLPPARIVPAIDAAIGAAPTKRARTLLHTARTAVIGNPVPAPPTFADREVYPS